MEQILKRFRRARGSSSGGRSGGGARSSSSSSRSSGGSRFFGQVYDTDDSYTNFPLEFRW